MNSELIIYKKCEAQVKRYCLLNNNQGLEGYFRDPGFDQNTVRDLEKKTKYLKGNGISPLPRKRDTSKFWAKDARFFCLSGIRKIARSNSKCESASQCSVVCPIIKATERTDRMPAKCTYLFIYQLSWTQACPEGMCTNGVRCHPYPIPQPVKVGHTNGV